MTDPEQPDQPTIPTENGEPVEGEVVPDGDTEEPTPAPTEEPNPEDFKPAPTDLEVRGPEDVFRAMDRADELLILDEIQGRALEVFVYDFGKGKQRKVDLSVAGVKEAVRLLNERGGAGIRVANTAPLVEEFQEGDESYYRVMVYAEDTRGKSGYWGTAVEPKHMKLQSGATAWDRFALTKALNKAERNALKKHIPEEIRQTIISMAREEDRVRVLHSAAASQIADLPPPLTDERAEELRTKIELTYDKLKGLNRMALPPARYGAYLRRSEHTHAGLERMLNWLEELVAEEERVRGAGPKAAA